MTEQIIIAGFGGQGVLSLGQMIAYAGMCQGKEVSWIPSYSAEKRGGTADCQVIVSDEGIASPVFEQADALIVLDRPSMEKYESCVKPGGYLFVNSSLVDRKSLRADIRARYIPANEIAAAIGNPRVAGMVMLGAYLATSGALSVDSAVRSLPEVLGERKTHLIPVNRTALEKGSECAGSPSVTA